MERLVMLWDELDELVGIGKHFAASLTHSLALRMRRTRRRLLGLAAGQA